MPSIPVRAALCAALLATPLLVLAQSSILPQQRDAAGNVMEPLGQVLIASETGPSGLYDCTRDGNWCVRVQPVAEEGDRPSVLEVLEKVQGQGKPHTYHVSIDVPQEADLSLWPWIVRLAPGVGSDETVTDPQQRARQNVLVGGIVKFSTMYSGGSADASTLQLARVRHLQDDIQVDDDVLTVPWLGNAMIRACFSEQDMKQRAGACHDEYGFSAKLGLDPVAEGMPVLRYQTVATRFPAGVSRFEDSLAKGPLKKKDLRTEQDPACSYTRLFRFSDGVFNPDQALPDCAGYTEPLHVASSHARLGFSVEPSLRSAVTEAQPSVGSALQRLLAAGGGDDVVLVHVHAQAILADVLGGDGAGADRVDQAGAALAGQAADVGFVGRLADCPAQLAGIAVAGTLDLRARGADAGRQQQGRRRQ